MPIRRQTDAAGENNSHHSTKYRIEEALGDLIDNCIDAEAKVIQIFIDYQVFQYNQAVYTEDIIMLRVKI